MLKFIPSLTVFPLKLSRISENVKPSINIVADKVTVRYAGHSKWQNIKKTKETNDKLKCKTFNYYIRLMKTAVFEGSPDPKLNSKLAGVIKQAQGVNMPLATINNVIKKFEYAKKNPHRAMYEYRNNNGVIFLIHASTDNTARTRHELNLFFKKLGIFKADESVRTAFISKGFIFAKPPENTPDAAEKAIEDAIEAEAEEVIPNEDDPKCFKFVCDAPDLYKVKSKLENKKYQIESAEVSYIARSPVELSEEEQQQLDEVLQKVEELPEIENNFFCFNLSFIKFGGFFNNGWVDIEVPSEPV